MNECAPTKPVVEEIRSYIAADVLLQDLAPPCPGLARERAYRRAIG